VEKHVNIDQIEHAKIKIEMIKQHYICYNHIMSFEMSYLPTCMDENDVIKIITIRNTIHVVNLQCPPRPQRPIPHFTSKTHELLAKLRENKPTYSLQES